MGDAPSNAILVIPTMPRSGLLLHRLYESFIPMPVIGDTGEYAVRQARDKNIYRADICDTSADTHVSGRKAII